jgi:O-antigen/teichoic acid export membrane protein
MLSTSKIADQSESVLDGIGNAEVIYDLTTFGSRVLDEIPRILETSAATSAETPTEASEQRDTRGGIALAIAVGVSSALSFAVHALASRQLTVADYGALAAVLALMTAAAVPVGAVQTALTRSAAEILAAGKSPSGRHAMRFVVPAALVISLVSLAAAPVTKSFLNLRTFTPVVFGGLWVGVVLIGSVGKSLLIAGSSHRPVAHAIVHGAMLRLIVAGAITPFFDVSGGLAAAIIGDVLASTIYIVTASRRGLFHRDGVPVRLEWPDAGRALSSQLSLWLFASLAVIVGRRSLTGNESGSFAAMSTAAAACLFLPQAVATIVFPRFVADGSRALLLRATGLAAAVGVSCAVAMTVRPEWLFYIFFGPQYKPEQIVLVLLCSYFVLLGCLTVITQYVVARRQGGALSIWCGLAAAIAATIRFGETPITVVTSLLVPTIAVTLFVASRAIFARDDANEQKDVSGRGSITNPDAGSRKSQPTAGDRLSRPATLAVSIVVPTYNGGDRLVPCVRSLRDTFDAAGISYELIVMVDGSTDGSERGLAALGSNIVVELGLTNIGKGAVLRRGFASARGSFVGFIDGDGDIAPGVLVELVKKLSASTAWVAVASKNQTGASVNASKHRKVMSAGYRMLVHWMFDLQVTDTQCGCKVFRREYLAATIDHARENGFALDLELLTIGSRMGLREAIEVPVVLAREDIGTVSTSTAFRMLSDTFRIHRRLPQGTLAPLSIRTLAPLGVDSSSALLP